MNRSDPVHPMSTAAALVGPTRPPFLLLCPVCVALGAAAVVWKGGACDPLLLLQVLAGALAAHIAVNALNEHDDFRSGLDLVTRRTPFSGGSGSLPARPDMAPAAAIVGWTALAATAAIGARFVHLRGPALLPLGLAGLFLAGAYTRWLTRHPLVCLVAPGLGFGPLMVAGTEFVLSGSYSQVGWIVSLVPFFQVSDLLLLNQLPDMAADRTVGRRHLPALLGRRPATGIYAVLLAGSYLVVVVAVLAQRLPASALLAGLTLPMAVRTARGAMGWRGDGEGLLPHLRASVVITLATPMLLAAGLWIGS